MLSIVSLHFYHLNFHFWAFVLSENHAVLKALSFCEGVDVSCGVVNGRLYRLSPRHLPGYGFKTVRIFPDDCQFSGWIQNCPD